MAKHMTFRGMPFNMAALADKQGDTVAVGNSGRNGRGDVIDSKGQVVATAKQVNAAYHKRSNKGVAKVSITQDPDERLQGQAPKAPAPKPKPAAPAPTAAASADFFDPPADPSNTVVNRRVFMDEKGEEKTEITYADGSVEIV